ncbi:MAG: nucleoid occlusion factor SlmA, partial [Candidatus Thiodiazotropha taylori]
RLLSRVGQFFERLETQLKQVLREGELRSEGRPYALDSAISANMMTSLAEGLMHQYLRSRFKISPLQHWQTQWPLLASTLFPDNASDR